MALAQTPSFIPEGGIPGCDFATGNVHASCVPIFIAHVIRTIFGFIGGVCLILIMYAGYQYILGAATGNSSAGKDMLKWAILGFVLSALSFFIIDFVIATIAGT